MKKILLFFGFLSFVFFASATVAALPWPWNTPQLVPLFFIVSTTIKANQSLWFAAMVAGIILDYQSFLPFGVSLLGLLLLLKESKFLFRNWFTNRSLLSYLILITIGLGSYLGWRLLVRLAVAFLGNDPFLRLNVSEAIGGSVLALFLTVGVWMITHLVGKTLSSFSRRFLQQI